MTDLKIFGDNFTNVAGIKAQDANNNEYTFINIAQSDEGKVVSNGSLVSQTAQTFTTNGTYDTTTNNSVTVNINGLKYDTGTFTFTSDTRANTTTTINHNLGEIPDIVVV